MRVQASAKVIQAMFDPADHLRTPNDCPGDYVGVSIQVFRAAM